MGNYKSRPQTSCSEELRKKIIEFHVVLRKKLQNDLQMPLPNEMSEFVEACALAQTERISTFAKIEEINQLIEEKGLYPCHLCCQSSSVVSTKKWAERRVPFKKNPFKINPSRLLLKNQKL